MAATLLAGCERAPEGGQSGGATRATTSIAPSGAVDTAYVARVLRATATDLGRCRQTPAMQGMAGADLTGEAIVAIDSSGSMAARSGTGSKMDEARAAVGQFVAALPHGARAGVLVFGDAGDNTPSGKGASCAADPRFVYGPAAVDGAAVARALDGLRPAGWTPLAAAIRGAAARFSPSATGRRTLFVVSDGAETCGGDPVAAARDAHGTGRVTVDVIGFGVGSPTEVAALRRVAAGGGGSYRDAGPGELLRTLKAQSVSAENANSGAVSRAESGMQQCYLSGIARERDMLTARIEADKAAGRINQPTYAAVVDASVKRFETDYGDFVRVHEGNMAREKAARRSMDGTVANAATPQ